MRVSVKKMLTSSPVPDFGLSLLLSRDSTLVIIMQVKPRFLLLTVLLLPEFSFFLHSKWASEAVGGL